VAFFIPQNSYYNHMKFAVIEYTTKTGQIWRPTPERPNYLCDPQKEIDPTSFACYTTALNGEHIPLTGLILENLSPPYEGGVARRAGVVKKAYRKLTGVWPQWHSLNYLKKFDTLLVVHQISNAHEILTFLRRLKKELPHIFVIGVPTQPFGVLQPHLNAHPDEKQIFRDYLNACDIFATVVKSTQSWYEALTQTPVVYLPQPYPYHYAKQFFKPRAQKEPIILVAGVTQRPDVIKGQKVAVALQQKFPHYEIVIPKVPELAYDDSALQGSRYRLLPFEQWREHLPTLAKTTLVINTDYTQTRGRVQTDCAAVGTPSLGADSDGQADLFPELLSHPDTPLNTLIKQAERLLQDEDYYQRLTHHATEHLKKYDYEDSATRLSALVKTYRS
jgi:hypothetical protein